MGTYTANYQLYMPTVGENGWGTLINGNFETIDTTMKSLSNRITAVENEVNGALSCTSVTTSGKITGNGGIAGTTGTFSGAVTAPYFNGKTKGLTLHFLTSTSAAMQSTAIYHSVPTLNTTNNYYRQLVSRSYVYFSVANTPVYDVKFNGCDMVYLGSGSITDKDGSIPITDLTGNFNSISFTLKPRSSSTKFVYNGSTITTETPYTLTPEQVIDILRNGITFTSAQTSERYGSSDYIVIECTTTQGYYGICI